MDNLTLILMMCSDLRMVHHALLNSIPTASMGHFHAVTT